MKQFQERRPGWLRWIALAGVVFCAAPVLAQTKTFPTQGVVQALNGNDMNRQLGALSLIADSFILDTNTIARGLEADPDRQRLLKILNDFQPKLSTPELQVKWLKAYPNIYPPVKEAGQKVLGYLSGDKATKSIEVQRAAADALLALAQNSVIRLGNPTLPPTILPQNQITATALALGPIASIYPWLGVFDEPIEMYNESVSSLVSGISLALDNSDAMVRKSGMLAIQALSDGLAEALPDPSMRKDEFTQNIFELKLKWIVLQTSFQQLATDIPKLRACIQSTDSETKILALRTVEAVNRARRLALDIRDYKLKNEDQTDRLLDLPQVDPLGDEIKTILPDLITTTRSNDETIRLASLEAVELIGADLWPYKDTLIRSTSDRSLFVRWVAARTMARMKPDMENPAEETPVISALTGMVADTDLDVRIAAMNALFKYGKRASSAQSALIAASKRGDVDARVVALKALEAVEGDTDQTLQALIASLQQSDKRVRRVAANMIAKMGKKGSPAASALQSGLNDQDPDVRKAFSEALMAID